MRAGFIGLGSLGARMARRIVESDLDLTIWARRSETLEPFADTAAAVARSPAELAASSDVVGICVMSDADVEDVVLREDGVLAGMAPGGIIAIHSTIHPETCRQIAARAAELQVDVIDAPVSAAGAAANAGRVLVMVGGDEDVLERAGPVLRTYGDPVLHLGPLGSGQVAKLVNNLLFTAHLAVALETFEFGQRLGVDRSALAQVIAKGSGASFGIGVVAGGGFGTAAMKQVAQTILTKDLRLMLDVAARAGVAEPPHVAELAGAALRMYAEG